MKIPSLGARYSVIYFSPSLSLSFSLSRKYSYIHVYICHSYVCACVPGSRFHTPSPEKITLTCYFMLFQHFRVTASHLHAIYIISERQPSTCNLFAAFKSHILYSAKYLWDYLCTICIECGWKSRVYLHIAHIYIHAYHESIHIRNLIYICTCIDAHTHTYIYIHAKAEIDRSIDRSIDT